MHFVQAQSAAALATLQKSCQAAKSMVAAGRVDDAFNVANSIDPNILKVSLTRADVILSRTLCLPLPSHLSHTCAARQTHRSALAAAGSAPTVHSEDQEVRGDAATTDT